MLGKNREAIPIIVQEDKMHLKVLSNGSVASDPGVEFLFVANLPTVVGVLCSKSELSYEMCWSEAQNNIDPPLWWNH